MSREIKFKAWLKDAKQMVEVRHISFFEGKTVVKIYDQPMSEEVWFELEDLELLQYTGLKDKNGVEIYEGDRCKFYGRFGIDLGVVKFERHGFAMCLESGYTYKIDEFWLEVIGNIYENKNLLEEK